MLEIKNLKWAIWNNNILNWVNLKIKEWEIIWIVWPNGCGKTSTINCINWFNLENKWEIFFYWENISKLSIEERAKKWIWRVFQSFWIFKNLTLFENLALAYSSRISFKQKLLPLSFLPKKIKEEIFEILKELDLYEKKDELAGSLSGGQMRLLEIARLYLQDSKLFLLDEPTAWVSPKLKNKVIKFIEKIKSKWKMLIIVEHDFQFLWEFVDRLVVMEEWIIKLDWKYSEIKWNKELDRIYFGK